jgi:hypothetical protein
MEKIKTTDQRDCRLQKFDRDTDERERESLCYRVYYFLSCVNIRRHLFALVSSSIFHHKVSISQVSPGQDKNFQNSQITYF